MAHSPTKFEAILGALDRWTPLATVLQDLVLGYVRTTALLVANSGFHCVFCIDLDDSTTSLFAGQLKQRGNSDGNRAHASLDQPTSLVVDATSDTLVVGERRTLRLVRQSKVSTLRTGFQEIGGLTISGPFLYVSDSWRSCIYRMKLDGSDSRLFAGTPGYPGLQDGNRAEFNRPRGLSADSCGNIYVADCENHVIRRITPRGTVSTLCGSDCFSGYRDGPSDEAKFNHPHDVAVRGNELIVTDFSNHLLRAVDIPSGRVTTLAGRINRTYRVAGVHMDGERTRAMFSYPRGVVVDEERDCVFVSCSNNTIRRVSRSGEVRTICGDGRGRNQNLCCPAGLALV